MKWIISRQIQHSPPLQQGASGPISGQTGLSALTTSGFCFLGQIRAFAIKTPPGLPNLNIKEKTKWILVVVVVKWRHRPNGLFDKHTELGTKYVCKAKKNLFSCFILRTDRKSFLPVYLNFWEYFADSAAEEVDLKISAELKKRRINISRLRIIQYRSVKNI